MNTQLSYLSRHWKPFAFTVFKESVAWLSVCLATYSASLSFTPVQSLAHIRLARLSEWLMQGWPLALVLLLIVCISVIRHWPRMLASYYDRRTDTRVIIECADLLSHRGQKIIHSVDTFDTALNTIITPRSLHGAFLLWCRQRQVALDELLDQSLRFLPKGEQDDTLPGRTQRYPLGTVCPLDVQGEPFALVSFARLQADGSIQISRQEYTMFLMKMWEGLSKPNIRHEVVNVAVMGNQFVDLPSEFTTEQKIDIMLQTFFVYARQHTTCKTLRICVHEKNAMEVDFFHYPVIIEHLAQRPELNF